MVVTKRVAIIGSGVAGLCAARHCSAEEGVECVVFEQSSIIGGTWAYTDETHTDKNGLPVHSSMYKSLRTNLPKEAMSYPDFPHTNKEEVSYLPFTGVLEYLKAYAEHFDLHRYIMFNQHVKIIHPIEENKWEVKILDLESNEERMEYFDGIIIGNGQNTVPRYPDTPGKDVFRGVVNHSHHYREPTPYKGQNVLVIGAGPSGLDLTVELAKVANKVYLSHHTDHAGKLNFPENVSLKSDVSHLTPNTVVFKDGSEHEIDVIMYCTGYLVQYSFLSEACKIYVEDNFVKPLYRFLISIEHPTLCILGLPQHLPVFYLCHIQSQFFVKTLTGKIRLPSKEEMHEELKNFIQKKLDEGIRFRHMMALGDNMEQYYNDLASKAGVSKMPQLIVKMYNDAYERIYKDFMTFRNNCYRIIDNENFSVVDMTDLEKSERSKNLCTPTCCRCRPSTERNI